MRRWRCFFPSKKQPPASHAAFPLSVPGCLLWTNSCRSRSASWKQSTGVDSQSQLQEKDVEFLGVSWNKSWKLKTNRCLLFTIFYLLDVDAMYISYITYITCIILGVQIWHTKKRHVSFHAAWIRKSKVRFRLPRNGEPPSLGLLQKNHHVFIWVVSAPTWNAPIFF